MGPLTQAPESPTTGGVREGQFLPPDTALEMSTQALRPFQRQSSAAGFGLKSVTLRRVYIFIGTAAMTMAGCYEMYEVLKVGGITILEGMELGFFVLVFGGFRSPFM